MKTMYCYTCNDCGHEFDFDDMVRGDVDCPLCTFCESRNVTDNYPEETNYKWETT